MLIGGHDVPPWVAALFTFVALFMATGVLSYELQQDAEQRLHVHVQEQLDTTYLNLKNAINQRLTVLTELSALVKRNPKLTQAEFAAVASELYAHNPKIRNLQLARYYVLSHQYPVSGNQGLLGLNLLRYEPTREVVQRTIDAGSVLIQGPQELIQGGVGFIARLAIQVPAADGAMEPWGLAAVVMDLEPLMAEAGVYDRFSDIQISLRGRDSLGEEGEVFYGEPDVFQRNSLRKTLVLPTGSWELAAYPTSGWTATRHDAYVVLAIGLLLALISAGVVGLGVSERYRSQWLLPSAVTLLFLGIFTALLWLLILRNQEVDREMLYRDAHTAQQALRTRLLLQQEYLYAIGREISISRLSSVAIHSQLKILALQYPELNTLDWFAAKDVRTQIAQLNGLQSRALALAQESQQAMYTPPFNDQTFLQQRRPSMELWLPAAEDLGVMRVRYDLSEWLHESLTYSLLNQYQVSLIGSGGDVVVETRSMPTKLMPLQVQIALSPPGHALKLRLVRWRNVANNGVWLLMTMAVLFAVGLFWGTWRLQTAKRKLENSVRIHTKSLLAANHELIQEIGERERAEHALAESREQLRRLVEGLHTSYVFSMNPRGVFTYVSSGVEKLLGYRQDEYLTHYAEFYSQRPENQYARQIAEAILRGESHAPYESFQCHKNGHEVTLEISAQPVFANNQVVAVEGIATNITVRKQIEDELEKYRERLEKLVAERTTSLEYANKELESFSYSVSHDLRSPLRSIDGFSKVLIDDYGDQLNAEAVGFLRRIRAAAQRMGRLIDALLSLSRLSQQKLNPQRVDLTQLAREILENLKQNEPGRDVTIELDVELDVVGDYELLRIVMNNLLDNAWKYTTKVSVAKITVGRCDIHGRSAIFVRDNGVGFDMQYSNKLFMPFERLHTEAEFSGTGIGLATVARIIRRHHGHIWAESILGEGTTFYFYLPESKFFVAR